MEAWGEIEENSEEELEIEEEYNWNSLPDHACSYCGNHNPHTVVKCISENCNRWFCNSYGGNKTGSHIIAHLVKARHKSVTMHSETTFGETNIECYVCSSKTVFLLGFVPSRSENTLIFLCREPCALRNMISDKEWDLDAWKPLIEEKRFLPWIVSVPTEEEDRKARKVTIKEISKIEEEIRNGKIPARTPEVIENIKKIKLRYNNPREYKDIYEKLVKLDSEYDREVKLSQKKNDINLRWERSEKKIIAVFIFSKEDTDVRLVIGDEMKLSLGSGQWEGIGTITRISASEEVELQITSMKGAVPSQVTGYSVEFVWKPTTFQRMQRGLQLFAARLMDGYILNKILGKNCESVPLKINLPKDLSAPNLPPLNHYQVEGVKKALNSRMMLIQGPPGTGKTVTSATIVYHMVQQKKGQVLICAPSNIAVDQLTEKLHQCGLKVIRVCAKSREAVNSSIDFLTLHQQVKDLETPEFSQLKHYQEKREKFGILSLEEEENYKKLRIKAESFLLSKAEVISCTCSGTFDPRLKDFLFRQVLIDEATQATEPECLLPILTGASQVIFVGDHCQLGPVVMCKKAAGAGYNRSLFERLVHLGNIPYRLHIQYRMHPSIAEFSSITFYEGSLQNGVSINQRSYRGLDFPWPVPNKPLLFYNTIGPEELSASGTSYVNRIEATNVEKIVTQLMKSGINGNQLGIITPYEGQRAFITAYLQNFGTLGPIHYREIEISSVDSFQGREKDFIILSCVRSNENLGIGFLQDNRRLNVALTRAKYGLIICGNAKVLAKQQLWNNLLNHYNENGVLVEGALNNLKQCMIKLTPPQKLNFTIEAPYIEEANNIGTFILATSQEFLDNL
jgi:regulator of nonsense transcripts 1